MTWPSIDGNTFITAVDNRNQQGQIIKDITPEGDDGHTFKKDGTGGEKYKVQTSRDKTTAAGAEALRSTYKDLIGSEVTYVDVNGQSHPNQFVLAVTAPTPEYFGVPVGGVEEGSYHVDATWILIDNS